MTVRIVTDSGSDITQEEAKQLGISVVPLYLRFGDEVYRDGIDIDNHEFYHKIMTSSVDPFTSAPSPGDFAKAYDEAAKELDEVVSIHITSKHSTTYDAALLGKEIAQIKDYRIEVIDSRGLTIWQGLVVRAAAEAAKAECSLHQVIERVNDTISKMRALALLDTVEYAIKGGRLGKIVSALGSILSVKHLLTLRDGKIHPVGLVRTRGKGIDRLYEFVRSVLNFEDLTIGYSTTLDDAQALADRIGLLFPGLVPRIARLGPALGVHTGPGALVVVVKE